MGGFGTLGFDAITEPTGLGSIADLLAPCQFSDAPEGPHIRESSRVESRSPAEPDAIIQTAMHWGR